MTENNFWNSCPRTLEYRPTSPCEHPCEWKIISKVNNNCFWTYIKNNSRDDGTMKPLQPSEIAKLLGTTTSKINEEIQLAEEALALLLPPQNYNNDVDHFGENIETVMMPEEELEDQDAFDIIIEEV